MNLQAYAPGILHGGYVGRDDGIHACRLRGIECLAGRLQVLLIEDDVQGQVGLRRGLVAEAHYFFEVFGGEIIGAVGAHVEASDAEIHRIGPALESSVQALEIARRRHYFDSVHYSNLKSFALRRASWSWVS